MAQPKISYPTSEPFTFLGLDDQSYLKSRVAILPIPYNSTTYWKSNTKEGPAALIEASRHLELYDHELDKDISQVGIYTLPEMEVSKNSPLETIHRVERAVAQIFKDKKFPLIIGGEHSITLGAVSAANKKFKGLSILQLDAHTDCRNIFEGTRYHHGCWARRAVELGASVTHVGIRSSSEEEVRFINRSKNNHLFWAPDLPIGQIISTLTDQVYVTIDLDVLDPSLMPSTGTPEPGGLGWYQTLEFLRELASQKRVVGADIVELNPLPGLYAPDFLAAKLAYKLIGYVTAPR